MANLVQMKILEDLDGFLLVDKPAGLAFPTVVKTVKRKFNLVKVGHGGSLDAMASGLLVLLVNDANKFVDRVMGADRSYTGTMKFGETTDTGDRYGRPMPIPPHVMTPAEVKGDLFQTEPRFCAVRREGAAEYEIVDTGEHKQLLAHVYRFEVGAEVEGKGSEFSLVASKGVIVRALAQDLGATLTSLRRTAIGKFDVADAVPFEKLLETDIGDFASCVMPLSKALP
jgi:tRNA pseudouridine55 synthase